MMEFPDLGKHCSETNCHQLDFLPVKCDSCGKVFCNDHFRYDKHNCPESYRKDNQVPVCPLCNSPVPVRKGQAPDEVVGQHIDNDCKQKKKVSNKCNKKGCKHKELIPVVCDKCRKNFCIRHRLAEDHECQGFEGTGQGVSNAGAAAMSRFSGPFKTSSKPQQTAMASVGRDMDRERREREASRSHGSQRSSAMQTFQAGMSEDEALAQAMAISMAQAPATSQHTSSDTAKKQQEEQDAALARALQQEEEAQRNTSGANRGQPTTTRQTSQSNKSSCNVS